MLARTKEQRLLPRSMGKCTKWFSANVLDALLLDRSGELSSRGLLFGSSDLRQFLAILGPSGAQSTLPSSEHDYPCSNYTAPHGLRSSLIACSGSGKTSLLNLLSGRTTKGKITGDIRVNGKPMKPHIFKHYLGYVTQEGTCRLFSPITRGHTSNHVVTAHDYIPYSCYFSVLFSLFSTSLAEV